TLTWSSPCADGLIIQRNRHDDAIVGAEIMRDVALACRVFDQVDVARPDFHFLAAGDFELCAAGQRDHELTPRAHVPVARRTGWPATEFHAGRLHRRGA